MEPLTTISETEKTNEESITLTHQLITPPPAYHRKGTQPLPSAPQLPKLITQQSKQSIPYEIPQPTINNPNTLIPSVKLMEIQNPPPTTVTPNTSFINLLFIIIFYLTILITHMNTTRMNISRIASPQHPQHLLSKYYNHHVFQLTIHNISRFTTYNHCKNQHQQTHKK